MPYHAFSPPESSRIVFHVGHYISWKAGASLGRVDGIFSYQQPGEFFLAPTILARHYS
jgi:hypothetical protein